jgi:pyruvate formate lyase activating enzyme
MKEALFYDKKKDNKTQCILCPHNCLIDVDRRGYCGVRKNIEGTLYSLTSDLVVSAAVDPVEKKPLYHFYPGALAYSLGGLGCNLACRHCQNHEISQNRNESAFSGLYKMPPLKVIEKALENNCKMIAWTYNEPTIWYEYIMETSRLARQKGIKTVLITNGIINREPLEALLPLIDAYRVDVKGFTNKFYKELTGFPFLNTVLASAETAYSLGCHVEIVTNIIPNWNDGNEHIEGISSWISEKLDQSVPWHVTAYHPANEMYEKATSGETLLNAIQMGKSQGLKHIYAGNIYTEDEGNTRCPGCKKTLIRRSGMSMKENLIIKGQCPFCGYPLKMYANDH